MPSTIPSSVREAQKVALARGDTFFSIPTPCVKGHLAPRYSSNHNCTLCKEEHNKNRKPEAERTMKLASRETRVVQFYIDASTASLSALSRKRMSELTGRQPSGSVIHKAAIAALSDFLNGPVTIAEVKALLR